jgi:hypothetical protein
MAPPVVTFAEQEDGGVGIWENGRLVASIRPDQFAAMIYLLASLLRKRM